MSETTRDALRGRFQNGDRPDGSDFTNLIDSCLNKASDGVSVDTDGNLVLMKGLRLSDSPSNAGGGLRYKGTQLEFHNGTNWIALSGGGGFASVGTHGEVAHSGNVGIGNFTAAAPPTYCFEVNLGPNAPPAGVGTTAEQVRLGNVAFSNGGVAQFGTFAQISHASRANSTEFALRQTANGATHINAAQGQEVSIRQGGGTTCLLISNSGNTVIGNPTELSGSQGAILQVAGNAYKAQGGGSWINGSDARIKEDVRDLEAGLAQLRRVRPVRFRYNGRAGTTPGREEVGVLGQEIETVFPETISKVPVVGEGEDKLEDLRVFNPSMLTFVLINAVKELAERVEHLEGQLRAQADVKAAQ
jgi:hypothetical protein